MEAKERLIAFMQRYHARSQFENAGDIAEAYSIHNELFPQNKEQPDEGCQACKIKILKKLQYIYPYLNSNLTPP